jgi:hypothetical protein
MPKSKGRKIQITRRALIQRINRKLEPDRKKLRATRAGRMRLDVGDYHVIDFRINAVTHTNVEVETMARQGLRRDSPTTEQEKKSGKFLAKPVGQGLPSPPDGVEVSRRENTRRNWDRSQRRLVVALAHEDDKNREQNGQRTGAKHGYAKKDLMHDTPPGDQAGAKDVSQSPVTAEGNAVMKGGYLMSGTRHNLK